MSPDRQSGYTLVELLITLAVLAALLAMGLPSFDNSMRSNRVATAANEMLASLSLARTESIKGLGRAGVCASADGTACQTGTDWSGGWLVWRERRTAGGTVVEPVRHIQAKARVSVTGPAAGVTFTTQGRSSDGARTLGFTADGDSSHARCVRLNVAGQSRSEKGACS